MRGLSHKINKSMNVSIKIVLIVVVALCSIYFFYNRGTKVYAVVSTPNITIGQRTGTVRINRCDDGLLWTWENGNRYIEGSGIRLKARRVYVYEYGEVKYIIPLKDIRTIQFDEYSKEVMLR